MKLLRFLGYGLMCLLTVGLISLGAAVWVYRDIPAEELESKYANQASRFMNIDGVRIHFRDEGAGPAVVLLHGNFASLLGWEPWVEVLRDGYRVIRFDMTSHGLTGPDPTGNYSRKRTVELLEKFIDAMGLEKFSIAGTSMGGTMAILYTSHHPDRIDKLILLNPALLDPCKSGEASGCQVPAAADALKYIMPRALPAFLLRSGFGDEKRLR